MRLSAFVADLKKIVGDDHAAVGRTDTELYAYDGSLAGGRPDVVVFPADTEQIAGVVRCAGRAGVPMVPRGFGTNLSGGTVMPSGGLVICLSRLNRILGVYPQRRCAVVQPGVTNLELQNALAPWGFFYAPDPASQKVATLGGNVGENSGGPRCLKYGVTTNHVLGLECILADGERVRLGGEALDPPGYDLRGVMLGSEGTLGIVSEIVVRILPLPQHVVSLLAIYDDVIDAAKSVSEIIAAGMVPATLEMMDAPVIKAVEESYACGYPHDAAAVLIIEVEGIEKGLAAQAKAVKTICRQNGCRLIRQAKDDAERNRLWEGRRGAFGAVARLAPNYLVNDCSVPRTRLPEALGRVAEIAAAYGVPHGNVFHAGDGNMHPLIFFDARDERQLKQVKQAGWDIMKACVDLGGTISGEHGIGVEKMDAMHLVFSRADLDAQRLLKAAFDPRTRLNPGKVIPKPTSEVDTSHRAPKAPEANLIEKVKAAGRAGTALLPLGGGHQKDYGNLSLQPLQALDSSAFNDVIDYDPDNQVVTAGSGMRLALLQKHLAPYGQWLPIRPPFHLGAHSIGGIAALAKCGPERLAYGAPRDVVLGMRFISADGQVISSGGNVVKNVAGYDMTRLMVGSAGTLGFITQVTCRVAMLPECRRAISAAGSLGGCAESAAALRSSHSEPAFIVALVEDSRPRVETEERWRLIVGFEGFEQTVTEQLKMARRHMASAKLASFEHTCYDPLDGFFPDIYAALVRYPFLFRADVGLNRLHRSASRLKGVFSVGNGYLDFGCGRMIWGRDALDDHKWRQWTSDISSDRGHLLLENAPEGFKKRHDVFGPERPEWALMHCVKSRLDPNNRFAPGRLPGRQ